jgi:hypothetical protein
VLLLRGSVASFDLGARLFGVVGDVGVVRVLQRLLYSNSAPHGSPDVTDSVCSLRSKHSKKTIQKARAKHWKINNRISERQNEF